MVFGPVKLIQKQFFAKNKILAPPQFLFFRRITIPRFPSYSHAVGVALPSADRRDEFNESHFKKPALFDMTYRAACYRRVG